MKRLNDAPKYRLNCSNCDHHIKMKKQNPTVDDVLKHKSCKRGWPGINKHGCINHSNNKEA